MAELALPVLTASIVAPLLATAILRMCSVERARYVAVTASLVSLAASLEAAREVAFAAGAHLTEHGPLHLFGADALSAVPMALYAALTLVVLALAPRRNAGRSFLSGTLVLLSGTLAAYASENLLVLLVGWAATVVPFLAGWFQGDDAPAPTRTKVFLHSLLVAGTVSLAIAVAIIGLESARAGMAAPLTLFEPRSIGLPASQWAFVFIMLAVVLRKGLFPAHSWVASAFENGPLLPMVLLLNGHLGAFLVARVALPLLPDVARDSFPLLGDFALFTAVYTAVLSLAEREPRRLLAMLMVSQSSFLLVGLESATVEGIAGALLQWLVVAVATTGLVAAYQAVEARLPSVRHGGGFYHGLAARVPRLAVFFAVCGLALVGLPGTLGFAAEDLLFHGALESHPLLGLALPLATALNAIQVFRLFSSIFLGRRATHVPAIPDALPRERWALAACVVFLVVGGLMPSWPVSWQAGAARAVAAVTSAVHVARH